MSRDQESPLEIDANSKFQLTTSKYPLPKNETEYELERKISTISHDLKKEVWGDNFVSPIKQELTKRKDFKVLDVGCGNTCEWLLELSKDYPLANFIGIDLLPRFPKDFSQSNLQFIQGDILKGLPFEDNSIDFVHMRGLLVSFTERQWEEIVIKELVRVCKPGGWVELSDTDMDGKSLGPTSKRLLSACVIDVGAKGINGLISEEIPGFFESTNQVEFHADEKYSPIGNWGDNIGKLAIELFPMIFQRYHDVSNWLKIDEKEYENMISQYKKEVESYHSYFISFRCYCQKYANNLEVK